MDRCCSGLAVHCRCLGVHMAPFCAVRDRLRGRKQWPWALYGSAYAAGRQQTHVQHHAATLNVRSAYTVGVLAARHSSNGNNGDGPGELGPGRPSAAAVRTRIQAKAPNDNSHNDAMMRRRFWLERMCTDCDTSGRISREFNSDLLLLCRLCSP